jgi:hypothetical protein
MIPMTNAMARSDGHAAIANLRIIDVHHHLLPPKYIAAVRETLLKISITPKVLDWTPASSLVDMDENGVRTAILSISAPGVWLGNVDDSRRVARECNEFAAKMVGDHRGPSVSSPRCRYPTRTVA